MAEILEGNTGHAHYAPLSHAQTVAVGRHLQDQIRQLQAQLAALQGGLAETNDAVNDLRKNSGNANSSLQNLQDSLANTNLLAEANRNDLARTNANVQKLQGGLDKTNEKVAKLQDGQKVNTTSLQKLEKDLEDTTNLADKLRETLENKIEQDLIQLRDELSRTNLDLKTLRTDQDSLKAALQDDKENLRKTDMRVKDGADKVAAANTMIKILEQRVADNTEGLKANRINLEDLNTATLKLHEDHENTKNHVTDLHNSIKKVHGHVKQVHAKLESTAQGLGVAQDKLDQQIDNAEILRQNLQHTHNKVQSLGEGHDRSANALKDLRRELAEVGATTQAVKAGLKEQSSLLLPNINMDSPEARMASARHGSLLQTNATGFMTGGLANPKQTPRGSPTATLRSAPKEMAWT